MLKIAIDYSFYLIVLVRFGYIIQVIQNRRHNYLLCFLAVN